MKGYEQARQKICGTCTLKTESLSNDKQSDKWVDGIGFMLSEQIGLNVIWGIVVQLVTNLVILFFRMYQHICLHAAALFTMCTFSCHTVCNKAAIIES